MPLINKTSIYVLQYKSRKDNLWVDYTQHSTLNLSQKDKKWHDKYYKRFVSRIIKRTTIDEVIE